MSLFLDKIARNSDFVWEAIIDHLGQTRRSRTNYVNFDCPMCVTMGETADTKKRCGVSQIIDSQGGDTIFVACFNCGFKSGYTLGKTMTIKFKSFLSGLGLEELEINQLNHRAFQLSRILSDIGLTSLPNPNRFIASFPICELPPRSKLISDWLKESQDPDLLAAHEYISKRGSYIAERAMWSPSEKWSNRIIFPAQWKGEIVGWTARSFDDSVTPKYLNEVPANFMANCDMMLKPTRYLILAEGFLDALAIDGVSPLGAKLNSNQITWLKETGKEIIVLPDRDKSGQRLIDVALEQDWNVAFPRLTVSGNNWWEEDCKDAAQAVERYGRLYTLRSIMETRTDRKLEIEIRRKWLY